MVAERKPMRSPTAKIIRFRGSQDGVTSIEYALIAALIALAILVGTAAVGINLNTFFGSLGNCLSNPPSACNF